MGRRGLFLSAALILIGLAMAASSNLPAAAPAATPDRKSAFLMSDLSAPPGAYKCRLVLRNLETGRGAVAAASTIVPAGDTKGLILFPPQFLTAGGGPSVYIDGGLSKSRGARPAGSTAAALFMRGLGKEMDACVPRCEGPFESASQLLAVARCCVTERAAAGLTVSAGLKDAAQLVYTVPLEVAETKADKDGRVMLLRLEIPRIPSGAYKLEITAVAGGSTGKVVQTIEIR